MNDESLPKIKTKIVQREKLCLLRVTTSGGHDNSNSEHIQRVDND